MIWNKHDCECLVAGARAQDFDDGKLIWAETFKFRLWCLPTSEDIDPLGQWHHPVSLRACLSLCGWRSECVLQLPFHPAVAKLYMVRQTKKTPSIIRLVASTLRWNSVELIFPNRSRESWNHHLDTLDSLDYQWNTGKAVPIHWVVCNTALSLITPQTLNPW